MPQSPCCMLYMNQMPGDTAADRGRALLDEVIRRKASGQIGPRTLAIVLVHGANFDGELLLGDARATAMLPAVALLNALATGIQNDGATQMPAAPVVLSCCHAEQVAHQLGRLERPLLINGSREKLSRLDSEAVLRACIATADSSWRDDRPLEGESLFTTLSAVSADRLHLIDNDDWVEHRLLESSASLHAIGPQQAGLHTMDKLHHGSVNQLAESLLLFGLAGYRQLNTAVPVLHMVMRGDRRHLLEKTMLLLAMGEDINQTNADGDTVLHIASDFDAEDLSESEERSALIDRHFLLRALLDMGADPSRLNRDGESPAMLAYTTGGRALGSVFEPYSGTRIPTSERLGRLRAEAQYRGWACVLSLLDDPRQVTAEDGQDPFASDSDTDDSVDTDDASRPGQMSENSDS